VIPSLWWSVLACIRPLSPGPDLGACAVVPDGVYRYGEAGIGTCLAGPADLSFFAQDGGTFLAVVNADPYRQFRSGSLLVLDWEDLDERLGAARDSGISRIWMDEVRAFQFEALDDDDGDGVADNPFFGGFGYLPSQQTAVLTSRLTEDGVLRTGRDEAFVLDLSRMELPGGGIREAGRLRLEDDPQPVVVDEATDRLFVGNLTDHTISVLAPSLAGSAIPLAEVDVAPDIGPGKATFSDLDGSGSLGEMTRLAVVTREDLVDDDLTLTWIDGTTRLFVPTPIEDTEVVGLTRWTSGGGEFVPTAFGPDEFFDETGVGGFGGTIGEPFVEVDEAGVVTMWFSREDGTIWRALQSTVAGAWTVEATAVRSDGGVHRAPSAAPLDEGVGLFTEREGPDGTGTIHLAVAPDGVTFEPEGAVLRPDGLQSFEQPFAVFDPGVQRFRMWLTVRTGDDRAIGLSESDDGRVWSDPIEVLGGPRDVAAPSVARLDGRYVMWTTVERPDGSWAHAQSWSWDGFAWTDPEVVAESLVTGDRPLRVGVQTQRAGAWRVSTEEGGALESLLPAGTDTPVELLGLELSVANGHALSNAIAADGGRPDPVVFPSSAVTDGEGGWRVYATAVDAAGRSRPVVYGVSDPGRAEAGEPSPRWTLLRDFADLRDELGLRPAETLSHPVAVRDDRGWVVFATLSDRDGARLVRLESDDGLEFGALDRAAVLRGESETGWDGAAQRAGSIEVRDGRIHLWYSGDDGSRSAIGSAVADDLRGTFRREAGVDDDFAFGTGLPGSFDDTGVADPLVVRLADGVHLYYAGFDGLAWHLGHALRDARTGRFVRRIDPDSQLSVPAMSGAERTFSGLGVRSPVLLRQDEGGLVLLYAGQDGTGQRIGRARVPAASPDSVFEAQRFPTAGDVIQFPVERGGPGAQVIPLDQATQWYLATGVGLSSLALDADRGFLFATTKLVDDLLVVDVHDDSAGSFVDDNFLDLETVVRVDTGATGAGFRDAIISRSRSLLYLTQRSPDALVAIELDLLSDDDSKAPTDAVVAGVLPLPSALEDAGADSSAIYGGGDMAMTADERYLLVPHFRQNGVSVFDLDDGAIGSELAWIPNVGENPTEVVISPDQRWAVVANYVGEVVDNQAKSSLAVIDLDPSSETWLEVVAWLVN
jgi:DNA-binding beta-propeller fold protein YncE